MLAHAVAELLLQNAHDVVGTDRELDVASPDAVAAFARDGAFDLVINCAAYTRVDDAEHEPEAAFAVNAGGAEHLGRAAIVAGAGLLHFSTDYVFDGTKAEPYTESDACRPLGVYGCSKRAGEERLLELHCGGGLERLYLVRTSWLFGEHGENFVRTMARLMLEREELSVVEDQLGRPTYTRDLAEASLALAGALRGEPARAPGLYHFANSGPTSWHGFATAILAELRRRNVPVRTRRVRAVGSEAFPRPAPRPKYSVLSTAKLESALGRAPRPYQEALAEYFRS
jgi:dTDP-4-dehydrorhamnose reductase